MKLKIKIEIAKNEQSFRIIEQDESLRGETDFTASNGMRIFSGYGPEWVGNALYIRGSNRGRDDVSKPIPPEDISLLVVAVNEFNGIHGGVVFESTSNVPVCVVCRERPAVSQYTCHACYPTLAGALTLYDTLDGAILSAQVAYAAKFPVAQDELPKVAAKRPDDYGILHTRKMAVEADRRRKLEHIKRLQDEYDEDQAGKQTKAPQHRESIMFYRGRVRFIDEDERTD